MNKLKQLLLDHPECLSSRNVFRSFLTDIFFNDKRTINILSSSYECGIVDRIRVSSQLTDNDIKNYIELLHREYGIEPQYGCECILTLLDAHDIPTYSFKRTFESNSSFVQPLAPWEKDEFDAVDERFESGSVSIDSKTGPEIHINGVIKEYKVNKDGAGYNIIALDRFDKLEISVLGLVGDKRIVSLSEDAFKSCLVQKRKTKLEHLLPNRLPPKALEAIDGLRVLGFKRDDAVKAVSSIPELELVSMDEDDIIRECLKRLMH